jgi:hypothetical protein
LALASYGIDSIETLGKRPIDTSFVIAKFFTTYDPLFVDRRSNFLAEVDLLRRSADPRIDVKTPMDVSLQKE